ncbi:CLCA3_4 [Mytilus coruscus]|uniref:CLCA3_4 n=1 Tax=Mytilus coruscus TaxID=42192 RepID=A0A6J8ADM2_MYTCO|nr:CLCA3_4 [Mytilus coruscus]
MATGQCPEAVQVYVKKKPIWEDIPAQLKIKGINRTGKQCETGKYDIFISSTSNSISGTLSILSKAASTQNNVLRASVLNTEPDISPLSVICGCIPEKLASADVSLNDGIYSGYILPYTLNANGRLSIKVITEGYFSKVYVPVSRSPRKNQTEDLFEEQSMGPFTRVAIVNEITIKSYKDLDKNVDLIPPSPILTLQLSNISIKDNTYTLTWFAVGDDFDIETAIGYTIRYSNNFANLKRDPENQQKIPCEMNPKEPG